MDELEDFKCPCCGGSLNFNAKEQNIKCPYCDSEFTLEDVKRFNESNAEQFEENTEWSNGGQEWENGETDGLKTYCCESCGGELIADENTAATACPYCGNAVVIKGRVSGTLKPDIVIPFKKTKDDAKQALIDFVRSKKLVLKAFRDHNSIEDIKGVYVPFWLYDADLKAHIVYHATQEERYSTGNTDVHITKHYRVFRGGEIGFDHIPVDGSTKMPDDIMESVEPYNYDEAVDFETAYLSGYLADKYDVDQEMTKPRATERIRKSTEEAFANTVTGYTSVRTESSSMAYTRTNVDYALYPVWMLNTKYNGETYTFAMNGQTGKIVGNLPLDKGQFATWFMTIFAVMFAAIFAVGSIIAGNLSWIAAVSGGLIGLCIALAIMLYLKSKLKTVRFQNNANIYYRNGSMILREKADIYLYKTERRTHRNNN